MFKKLDNLIDRFAELGIPAYDCIVMKDGEVVYRRMGGFSDYEGKVPVNGKERYNIYSASKPITCVAALQLLEQGKFKLTDKLSDYMPEFENMTVRTEQGPVPAENPIYIKDLFTMTSGFDYGVGWPVRERMRKEGPCATREVMKELAKQPLPFQPGKGWQYGLSHDILAALVEVVSGKRFGLYVKENIFDPLGMENSTFLLPDEELATLCAQYRYNAEKNEFEPIGPEIEVYKYGELYESGGAGCISTVEDYIKLLEALRIGDVILSKETTALMMSNMLTEEQAKTFWKVENYNYGLGVRCPKEGKSFDYGWGGAAGAFLMVDPMSGITAYYAQHVLSSPNGPLRDLLAPTISGIYASSALPEAKPISEEILKKYL